MPKQMEKSNKTFNVFMPCNAMFSGRRNRKEKGNKTFILCNVMQSNVKANIRMPTHIVEGEKRAKIHHITQYQVECQNIQKRLQTNHVYLGSCNVTQCEDGCQNSLTTVDKRSSLLPISLSTPVTTTQPCMS